MNFQNNYSQGSHNKKTQPKDKPKTKLNINPANVSLAEMNALEKSKKGKIEQESKPTNHWAQSVKVEDEKPTNPVNIEPSKWKNEENPPLSQASVVVAKENTQEQTDGSSNVKNVEENKKIHIVSNQGRKNTEERKTENNPKEINDSQPEVLDRKEEKRENDNYEKETGYRGGQKVYYQKKGDKKDSDYQNIESNGRNDNYHKGYQKNNERDENYGSKRNNEYYQKEYTPKTKNQNYENDSYDNYRDSGNRGNYNRGYNKKSYQENEVVYVRKN